MKHKVETMPGKENLSVAHLRLCVEQFSPLP
jgi:hypothetical protein